MPKIRYINKRFSPDTQVMIRRANQICDAYASEAMERQRRQLVDAAGRWDDVVDFVRSR